MKLLDSNTCIRFLNGEPTVVQHLQRHRPNEVALCSVVKAELYFGVYNSGNPAKNLSNLERFFQQFISLPFDDDCSRTYGQIRAQLKRTGQPIGPNDLMIAAIALTYNYTLVTHNQSEFSRVIGLQLEDWEI